MAEEFINRVSTYDMAYLLCRLTQISCECAKLSKVPCIDKVDAAKEILNYIERCHGL